MLIQSLRQIQLAINEGAALVRHVGRKHADLAAGDLARRSGVLPTDAARVLALLEKAGLVDHQHRPGGGERLERIVAHHVPQGIGVPVAAAEHRLLAPRARVARGFRPHPAGLAPLGPEHPIEEGRRRGARHWDEQTGIEIGFDLTQLHTPEFEHLLDGHTRHGSLLGQIRRL